MAQFTLEELDRVVFITNIPSHAKDQTAPWFAKKASYMEGEYPSQLVPFAGQIAHCPVECEGRKGQDYRECLKMCAAEKARPEEEKRARRKEYSRKYRELQKKIKPRRIVKPKIALGVTRFGE
mgnify:CR=1 FL=1